MYRWGWKNEEENWYYFDSNEEILSVVTGDEEVIYVPYEEMDEIEYIDGKAKINLHGMGFSFDRVGTNSEAATDVLWNDLARTDTPMNNWPYDLKCGMCERVFGHYREHGSCPFDNNTLKKVMEFGLKPRVDSRIGPYSTKMFRSPRYAVKAIGWTLFFIFVIVLIIVTN